MKIIKFLIPYLLQKNKAESISINSIIFNSDLGPGFDQQNFIQNFYDALDAGYNKIYIGTWGLSGSADVLDNWKQFTETQKSALKSYAASKNAKFYMYTSGDNIENQIIGGTGADFAAAAVAECQSLGLDGILYDLRIGSPNAYINVYANENARAAQTRQFLDEVLATTEAAFPGKNSHRIHSVYLGQWTQSSATADNFPAIYGQFLNDNSDKFENVMLDYFYGFPKAAPALQTDELTLFQNSSTLTADNTLVAQTGMSDFTQSTVDEILSVQNQNIFTVGKPLEDYRGGRIIQVHPNFNIFSDKRHMKFPQLYSSSIEHFC